MTQAFGFKYCPLCKTSPCICITNRKNPCKDYPNCKSCSCNESIYIKGSTVYYTGDTLPCSGIAKNTDLNTALSEIDTKLCSSGSDCCKLSEWINITLTEGYHTVPDTQIPQYAIDPANGKIWLRGTFSGNGISPTNAHPFTLSIFPLFIRSFLNTWANYTSGIGIVSLYSAIDQTGLYTIIFPDSNIPDTLVIFLDGLSYETN